jgi:signal recognition particle GTPase
VFSIQRALELPVRYIGTGESLELLEPFDREAFVDAILSSTVGSAR